MARLRYNGLTATLGAALTTSATSVTFGAALTHANGVAVPTIASPDYIPLSILDSSGNFSEIVYLTSYTSGSTTGTITRAAEGAGTAVAHNSGDKVVHGPTALDATPALVLLKQITLGADAASLAFTSSDIPTSGFSHLRIVAMCRSTQAASGDSVNIAFNGDTTATNYKYQVLQGASGATAAVTSALQRVGYVDAASDAANGTGLLSIDITDYLGSWNKIAQSLSSKAGDPVAATFMVRWANTAAITAVSLTCGANFKAGSKAWLYGVA